MCWAVPAKVVKIDGPIAQVDFGGGAYKTVVLAADGIQVGDIVLVHAGAVIGRIRREEFIESLNFYREMMIELATEGGAGREKVKKELEKQFSTWMKWLKDG